MEINTTYPKQNTLVKPGSSTDQKKMAAPDEAGEKSKPITDDSVVLSRKSLELSQSAALQDGLTPAAIESREQAQKAVAQLVSSLRENPGAAKQIHGNISQVNLKLLLE